MKSRGRTKVGSSKGNPGYRTPSFFKNKPVNSKQITKISKIMKDPRLLKMGNGL